jgi:hypothetical protein
MANELNISTFMQGDAKRSGLYTEGVIGLDANSNKLINDMANTYVAKKEQLYNQWEDAYKTALTAANTTQGAFYKDLPELQTEGKALNKWIAENRGILTADGAIKNPQLYQEFLARMGDYSSKYEAAKANSVVNNKFKEALNDPQKYDAQATKILYDNWINGDIDYRAKNPYMPQVSVPNMFDDNQKKTIVEGSISEISPEMQVVDKDKGTAYYNENKFYSKEQMYNNLNQASGGSLQQKYELYGKDSGKPFDEWVESQISSIAPSSKTVQLGDKTYYVVPKEGQFRANIDEQTKVEKEKATLQNLREIAKLKLQSNLTIKQQRDLAILESNLGIKRWQYEVDNPKPTSTTTTDGAGGKTDKPTATSAMELAGKLVESNFPDLTGDAKVAKINDIREQLQNGTLPTKTTPKSVVEVDGTLYDKVTMKMLARDNNALSNEGRNTSTDKYFDELSNERLRILVEPLIGDEKFTELYKAKFNQLYPIKNTNTKSGASSGTKFLGVDPSTGLPMYGN